MNGTVEIEEAAVKGPCRVLVVTRTRRFVGKGLATFDKSPIAVILADEEGVRALDLRGELLDLDSLQREVPELAKKIASIEAP